MFGYIQNYSYLCIVKQNNGNGYRNSEQNGFTQRYDC